MAIFESDINNFLKAEIKENGFTVLQFQKALGISKTTLFRIMKGYRKPTEIQQEKIIELLKFDELKQDIFLNCIKQLEFDDNERMAFKEIESLLIGADNDVDSWPNEFVVWDKGKTVLTFDGILDLVRDAAKSETFSCEIRIYSCVHGNVLEPIGKLLDDISEKSISVKHYIKFYEEDALEDVLAFRTTLPLLRHEQYQMYSRLIGKKREVELMDDIILIRIQERYLVLSFNDSGYHECYNLMGQKWYSLFLNRWNAISPMYELLSKELNINLLLEITQKMEEAADSVYICATPCVPFIEPHIWRSLKARLQETHYNELCRLVGENELSREKANAILEAFIEVLEKRHKFTYRNSNYHLVTDKGLRDFVETGILSDHYSIMPPFTKEEAREIVRNLWKRHNDPDDKFRLIIVHKDTTEQICIVANENGEVAVGCAADGGVFNCFMTQKRLADTFVDFASKYAPENIAMSDKKAQSFIAGLV